jgi:hypothetical protein
MKRISYLFIFFFFVFILSCKKEKDEPAPVETVESLLCNGTWIEDYTIDTDHQIVGNESNKIPDIIVRKNIIDGAELIFDKNSGVKYIDKSLLNPIESTWNYDHSLQVLFTKLSLNLSSSTGYFGYFYTNSGVKVNKNELILIDPPMFSLERNGKSFKLSRETHFKH